MKRLRSLLSVLALMVAIFSVACERGIERDFRIAELESRSSNWRTALSRYENVMRVDPTSDLGIKSAREAARISFYEVKDYERTLQYLRHLVLYSPKAEESVAAQKQTIDIYFEQIQNYAQAIQEILRLLQIERSPEIRMEWKLKLARSYFHLNNLFQASAEVSDMLKRPEAAKHEFDLKLLQANILTANKSYGQSIVLLKELMTKWPDKALHENVPMTLAVCYEEMLDFKAAIDVLEAIKGTHPVPEYVELRLKRMRDRKMNQPGARGWRK